MDEELMPGNTAAFSQPSGFNFTTYSFSKMAGSGTVFVIRIINTNQIAASTGAELVVMERGAKHRK